MNKLSLAASLVTAIALSPASGQAAPADPLSQDELLRQILPKLKLTLRDPYSIRDFSICAPRGVKWKAGRPDRWTVLMTFNARNEFGGYSGAETWAAMFRNGELARSGLVRTQLQSTEGLMGVLNRPLQRELDQCARVPDEELQRRLSGETR